MTSLIDYNTIDYRGFVFVVHDEYGLMLLHCTRKPKKGPHWQLPGGHVDKEEFDRAARVNPNDAGAQLVAASARGAARELYEETGVDVRTQLDRLVPAFLKDNGPTRPRNEHKNRLFFTLRVSDKDFPKSGGKKPLTDAGSHLELLLSVEHSGFRFQPDLSEAACMLELHSGGKVSEALVMVAKNDFKSLASKTTAPFSVRRKQRQKSIDASEGDPLLLPPKAETKDPPITQPRL